MEATLPVARADQISARPALQRWLVQDLWAHEAVGIVGGEPKCFKSFLALDLAVSVASGAPCLRRFPVQRTGPVLLFPAEDALCDVRARLEQEDLAIRLTEEAIQFLVEKGYDEKFGARPLKRAIQKYLEDPLSEKILMAEFSSGDEIEVSLNADGSGLTLQAGSTTKT